MQSMRHTAGQNLLNYRRNEDILEELNVDRVEKKIPQYKQIRLNHVSTMKDTRYPK